MANLYYHAPSNGGAQTIPAGFDDQYDWSAIGDDEKARRGWVRAAPPLTDPDWERVEITFTQDGDGAWTADYAVMPGDIELARTAARAAIANRRWQAEVGGMSVPGFPTRVATDREVTQAKITAAYTKALANPAYEIEAFEIVPGTFIRLDNATVIALGDAMEAHIQGGFRRAKAINALLDAEDKTEDLRATLAAEIDRGWPGQDAEG